MKSVLQYIQRHAATNGKAIAFSNDERSVTYAHLLSRAAAYRDCLVSNGCNVGSRIGVALSDDIEAMAAIIGIWACQATAVPIDFRNRKSQRKETFDAFNLTVILEDMAGDALHYSSIAIGEIAEHGQWKDINEFEAAPAILTLTSGTTGQPSGIVLHHHVQCNRCETYQQLYSLNSLSRNLICYPISFSASRSLCILTLIAGGQNCIAPILSSGKELAAFIRTQEITEAYLVPATLEALINAGEPEDFVLLRYLAFGSAPAAESLKARALDFFHCNLFEIYSATSTGALSYHTAETLRNRPEAVGRIFAGVELEIADSFGNTLGIGQIGLVRTRGPALITEVIGGHTGSDFVKDGWAYPGDLGSLDGNGFLTLAGRSSDMIVRGGEKIHPLEIEAVILQHPSVIDVAVLAIPHLTLGEQVAAVICLNDPQALGTLRGHCISRLPGNKVPAQFKLIDEIPRNANGKIMRKSLTSMFLEPLTEGEK